MQNMVLWLCKVKDIPGSIVRVIWHRDGMCGFSFVAPDSMCGEGGELEETQLIPVRRPPSIKPSGTPLEKTTSEELRAKLEELHNVAIRIVTPKKNKVVRKRKGATSGGLLGIMKQLSKEKQVELHKLLASEANKTEILAFLKEAINDLREQSSGEGSEGSED